MAALESLGGITRFSDCGVDCELEPGDLSAAAYLLSATANRLGNQTFEPNISEVHMHVCKLYITLIILYDSLIPYTLCFYNITILSVPKI